MNLLARALTVVTALLIAACVVARPQTGTISGTVIGSDSNIVAGARVTLQNANGKNPQTRVTDKEGHFHFRELPKGLYDLRAYARGAASTWHHNVLLQVDKEVQVELHLQPIKASKSNSHSKQ